MGKKQPAKVLRPLQVALSSEDWQPAEMNEFPARCRELSGRSAFGFVVGRALLQSVDKVTAGCGHAHRLTSHDFLGFDRMTIDLLARFVVRAKRGAFQRYAGKHAA
jgi:hypothetical protein